MHAAENMVKCKKSRSKLLREAYAEGYEKNLIIDKRKCAQLRYLNERSQKEATIAITVFTHEVSSRCVRFTGYGFNTREVWSRVHVVSGEERKKKKMFIQMKNI